MNKERKKKNNVKTFQKFKKRQKKQSIKYISNYLSFFKILIQINKMKESEKTNITVKSSRI